MQAPREFSEFPVLSCLLRMNLQRLKTASEPPDEKHIVPCESPVLRFSSKMQSSKLCVAVERSDTAAAPCPPAVPHQQRWNRVLVAMAHALPIMRNAPAL